jgi:hypothetical protein
MRFSLNALLALGTSCIALLSCFSGVSAGFSAQLVQSAGAVALGNGANMVNTGGATWSTTTLNGFTDGQFMTSDGGYVVPSTGIYHFDANILIDVASTTAPNQNVDLRLVNCASGSGCNSLCFGGTVLATTIQQSGAMWLPAGFSSTHPPNYSLSASMTGYFNAGDTIAVCVDNWAATGAVKINCPGSGICRFSGMSQ